MINSKLNIDSYSVGDTNYQMLNFDDLQNFNEFVANEKLTDANLSSKESAVTKSIEENYNTDWYGLPIAQSPEEIYNHNHFLGMDKIDEVKSIVKPYLEKMNERIRSILPERKLDYNDRNLGIFSFDRAMMGMYKLNNIDLSTSLSTQKSQIAVELGRTKPKTTVKKIFAYFSDQNKSADAVTIYQVCGGAANIDGDNLLYTGIATSILVEYLEKRNIPVQVKGILASGVNGTYRGALVTLKSFQNKFDMNTFLLFTSDPRYFRCKGFLGLISTSNYMNFNIPSNLGSPASPEDFLEKYENSYSMGKCYSVDEIAKQVESVINKYVDNDK